MQTAPGNNGIRARGAGVNNRFMQCFKQVATFHHTRRRLGHAVDNIDCYSHFADVVTLAINAWRCLANLCELPHKQNSWLELMEESLTQLHAS